MFKIWPLQSSWQLLANLGNVNSRAVVLAACRWWAPCWQQSHDSFMLHPVRRIVVGKIIGRLIKRGRCGRHQVSVIPRPSQPFSGWQVWNARGRHLSAGHGSCFVQHIWCAVSAVGAALRLFARSWSVSKVKMSAPGLAVLARAC